MKTAPYFWLKRIDPEILKLDSLPLFSHRPSFPWDSFIETLKKELELDTLSITAKQSMWRTENEIQEGLGEEIISLPITLTPLAGPIYWLMNKEEISKLTQTLLLKKPQTTGFDSAALEEGFYRFLSLQALQSLQTLDLFKDFSGKISLPTSIPTTPAYSIDIQIEISSFSFWGRVLIPPTFQKSWKEFFAQMPIENSLKKAAQVELPAYLEAGKITFTLEEWEKLQIGDFIVLDSLHPQGKEKKSLFPLVVGGVPLFQAKLKQEKIKILDYAYHYKEQSPMEHPPSPSEEATETALPPEEVEGVSLKTIPLSVTVELARFKMSLEKLMELEPGNFIELPIHPNQTVDLTVEGKKIAQGELVHLGETLGVRIIQLGK